MTERRRYITLFLAIILLASGCNSEYKQQIEEMKLRLDMLEELCRQYNEQVMGIRSLVEVVQSQDMVTGFTTIKDDDGKDIGYRILFLNHDPVVLYHGIDGAVPYIGSKRGEDGVYYWTIRYNGGQVDYLRDDEGNRVQCMGDIPYITIRDKKWYITYDGVSYNELGPADGENADSIFKRFIISENAVEITLSNGTIFKIPLYSVVSALRSEVDIINNSVEAQRILISAWSEALVYIKEVTQVTSASGMPGMRIELSNGQSCEIYNTVQSNVPVIQIKKDGFSGSYYWAMAYGDNPVMWIYTEDNRRISAVGNPSETPVVGMSYDEESQQYCWTVTVGSGTPVFITDGDGNKIPAMESAANPIFKSVDNTGDIYLVVELLSGEIFRIPKAYTIEMETTIRMRPNTSAYIPYRVHGDNAGATVITVMAQDGFQARVAADGRIMVDAPADFTTSSGQVLVIFDVCGLGTRIVTKTLDIINQGGGL